MELRKQAVLFFLVFWSAAASGFSGDILKGAARQDGVLPIWSLRDGRTLVELPKDLLGKPVQACALKFGGDWAGWLMLDHAGNCWSATFSFDGKKAGVTWRGGDSAGGAMALGLEGQTPEGAALVDAARLATADWTGVVGAGEAGAVSGAEIAGARAGGRETRLAYWSAMEIGGVPSKLLIRLAFINPQAGAMPRREASPLIGHILGDERSRGRATQDLTYPIMRWSLQPQGGASTRPIRAILSASIPQERREAVRLGVLAWLPVFEKAGVSGAIEVIDGNGDIEDMLEEGAVLIGWDTFGESNVAAARSTANDATGETAMSSIMLSGAFPKAGRTYQSYIDPDSDEAVLEAAGNEFLRRIVMHEFGHALGLEHNFLASGAFTVDEALRPGAEVSCASAMDYMHMAVPSPDGRFVLARMNRPGPYDEWAIEYAYRPLQGDEGAKTLERIEARGLSERALAWGSAQGSGAAGEINPFNMPYDFSGEPVKVFSLFFGVAKEQSAKGSRKLAGKALIRLAEQGDSLERILAGGDFRQLSESRSDALAALAAALREDGVEALGPWDEGKDFSAEAMRLLAETAASAKVARVAPYLYGDGLSYEDILKALREAIWGGTLAGKTPSERRAKLLHAHAKALDALLSDDSIPRKAKEDIGRETAAVAEAVAKLPEGASKDVAMAAAKPILGRVAATAARIE